QVQILCITPETTGLQRWLKRDKSGRSRASRTQSRADSFPWSTATMGNGSDKTGERKPTARVISLSPTISVSRSALGQPHTSQECPGMRLGTEEAHCVWTHHKELSRSELQGAHGMPCWLDPPFHTHSAPGWC
ncbi:hypothetical protein LEMLEM_LOCUS24627, partial [Lemmus lemmus]